MQLLIKKDTKYQGTSLAVSGAPFQTQVCTADIPSRAAKDA